MEVILHIDHNMMLKDYSTNVGFNVKTQNRANKK